MKKITYFLTCTLGILLFCGSQANAQAQQAPHFHLSSLEGTIYTDQNLIGQTTLLMFWNSWCDLCPSELPKIYALQEKLGNRKFQVLAISIADTDDNINNYVLSHPLLFNFPVLYDFGDRMAMDYQVNKVPTFFLLNERGELELAYQGEGFLEHPLFQVTLDGLLGLRHISNPIPRSPMACLGSPDDVYLASAGNPTAFKMPAEFSPEDIYRNGDNFPFSTLWHSASAIHRVPGGLPRGRLFPSG